MDIKDLHQRGRRILAALMPDSERRLDSIFRAAPALEELAVGVVYGHLHSRMTLDPRTREAVAVAAIVSSGCTGTPLTVHCRTAMAAGLTPAEITEVTLETSAFSGFPRAVQALETLARVFEESGVPTPPTPAPREALAGALRAIQDRARPRELGEQLAAAAKLSIVTVDPDIAIAVIDRPDQSPYVIYARIRDGEIPRLATAELNWIGDERASGE